MKLDGMLPLPEYAAKIKKNPVSVLRKIQRGNLSGAVKFGRDWWIPENAPYEDKRVTSGKYKDWRDTSMIVRMMADELDVFEMDNGEIKVGNVYTVLEKTNVNSGAKWHVLIPGDRGGVGGNMNPSVKRYHGWRGTTNDVSTDACGVHQVEEIFRYKNGNVKIKLGVDLKEDEE